MPKVVRYIKPETICIGDVIRATVKHNDVEVSHVGTVAARNRYGQMTEYVSASGVVILETYVFDDRKVTVTLLDRPSTRTPALFDMEKI